MDVGMALLFKVGDHSQMVPVPKNFPKCSNYMPNVGDDITDNKSQAIGVAGSICVLIVLSIFNVFL